MLDAGSGVLLSLKTLLKDQLCTLLIEVKWMKFDIVILSSGLYRAYLVGEPSVFVIHLCMLIQD